MSENFSGGCQCGAVRYRFSQRPTGAHICHCRMCQKAVGNFYASFVGGSKDEFEITRGKLATYKSSNKAERGFCDKCGTPLSMSGLERNWISVSIGSLDNPEAFPPIDQHGVESRMSYANAIGDLPDQPFTEIKEPDWVVIKSTNHQHPDHDTKTWPPTE